MTTVDLELTVIDEVDLAPACDWWVQRPSASSLFGETVPCPDAAIGWVRFGCGALFLSCESHFEMCTRPGAVALCEHGRCTIVEAERF